LPNIAVALDHGVRTLDSSIGGLGGCPYAHGASGNVATEDVIYMLEGMGMRSGVDLDAIIDVARYVFSHLNRRPASRVSAAKIKFQ